MIAKRNRSDNSHTTQIIVAVIGLLGILITAFFANLEKIFPTESSGPILVPPIAIVKSQSRTCKYTSGPKAGTTQYFSPEEYPVIRPAIVGQSCTDGIESTGIAIQDFKN